LLVGGRTLRLVDELPVDELEVIGGAVLVLHADAMRVD
jgi:hypothetical protein